GSPTYPEFDLTEELADPRVEFVMLPSGPELPPAAFAGLDAVVLGLERVSDDTFAADGRLTMVARWGVGYERIDVDACTRHDAALAIMPDGVRRPVAVAIMALMLSLVTQLPAKDRLVRAGAEGWARRTTVTGLGLVGRTLGSVGMGNIGAELFRLAKPFDMAFIAHDPAVSPERARELGVELVELDGLFRRADVIAVNCPLTPATRHIVSAERIGLMKPTAFLVNTSRGGTVDQRALYRALAERRIAGAGLDVFDPEPPDPSDPLLQLDNVVLAPHTMALSDQTPVFMGTAVVEALRAVMAGGAPPTVVNRDVLERPGWRAKLARYAGAAA
ncbi:MAG TPA: NAD(P)-dependent oxidoreductase, partial [Geminicoccaceae bacterium]|nr:NAD(P)-dependent oxidoreductase [Geminicoccaceae bacterium]